MAAALALVIVGCSNTALPSPGPETPHASPSLPPTSHLPSPRPTQVPSPASTPPALWVSNGTSLLITLVLDGVEVAEIQPHTSDQAVDPSMFPPAPWHLVAQTPTGRALVEFDIRPENVWWTTPGPDGHSDCRSAGARADLSCGRLDVWSGMPLLGPVPPSSFPAGDCDP